MSEQDHAAGKAQLLNGDYSLSDGNAVQGALPASVAAPYIYDGAGSVIPPGFAGSPAIGGVAMSHNEKVELLRYAFNSIPYQRVRVPYADACFAFSIVLFQLPTLVSKVCYKENYDAPVITYTVGHTTYYRSQEICDLLKLVQSYIGVGVILVIFGFIKILLEIYYNQHLKSKIAEIFFGVWAICGGIYWIVTGASEIANDYNSEFSGDIGITTVCIVCLLVKGILSLFLNQTAYAYGVNFPNDKLTFVQKIVHEYENGNRQLEGLPPMQQPLQQPLQQMQGIQMHLYQHPYVVPVQQHA